MKIDFLIINKFEKIKDEDGRKKPNDPDVCVCLVRSGGWGVDT